MTQLLISKNSKMISTISFSEYFWCKYKLILLELNTDVVKYILLFLIGSFDIYLFEDFHNDMNYLKYLNF
jgi:hypothetical protein